MKQKIKVIPNPCPSSIIRGGDHSRLLTSGCVALKVVHEDTISGREQTQDDDGVDNNNYGDCDDNYNYDDGDDDETTISEREQSQSRSRHNATMTIVMMMMLITSMAILGERHWWENGDGDDDNHYFKTGE